MYCFLEVTFCSFYSALYWIGVVLLLNTAVVKKEKTVFNLWLKLCPHPQSAAADLHNIATHHQVCSAARLWLTTELRWGPPPGGPVLQRADEASQVFQT